MEGARGERILLVDNKEVRILFTNRALAGAERRLSRGIVAIVEGFNTGSSGLFEVATLLNVGMEASRVEYKSGGKPVSMDDAYDILDKVGFATAATSVVQAVADVISFEPETNGNDPNLERSSSN